MRAVALGLIVLLGAGCATRLRHPNPYIPPEAMPTVGGTLAAMGGVTATAVGAHMLDRNGSGRSRRVGAGLVAAGAGMLGLALIEAIELEREREKLEKLDAAFRRQIVGSPNPENSFRPAPPPLPEVPFHFDRSPLSGEEP